MKKTLSEPYDFMIVQQVEEMLAEYRYRKGHEIEIEVVVEIKEK